MVLLLAAAVLLVFLGGFLMAFGFWGIDYAFLAYEQWKAGHLEGDHPVVRLPGLRKTMRADDWWNWNWFAAIAGGALAVLGAFLLGWSL